MKTRKNLRKVAKLLENTSANCLCGYRSSWQIYLNEHDKRGFTLEEVVTFIDKKYEIFQ